MLEDWVRCHAWSFRTGLLSIFMSFPRRRESSGLSADFLILIKMDYRLRGNDFKSKHPESHGIGVRRGCLATQGIKGIVSP